MTITDKIPSTSGRPRSAEFIKECLRLDALGSQIVAEDLYDLYLTWCTAHSYAPLSIPDFQHALAAQGLQRTRRGGVAVYADVAMAGPAGVDFVVETERPMSSWAARRREWPLFEF